MPRREPPEQPLLFDDLRRPAARGVVALAGSTATLGRVQQTFNRLIAQIELERSALARWQAASQRSHQRATVEIAPLLKEVDDARRALALRLDALLHSTVKGEQPSRRHRARVQALLARLVPDLLARGPDPELQAVMQRLGGFGDDEHGDPEQDFARALAGQVLGEELPEDASGLDMQDVMRRVAERLRQADEHEAQVKERRREARAQRRREQGKGPTKTEQAAQAREQALKAVGQSVRAVFRQLASHLHPDRETDPAERERKTALMQKVNDAYAANDLLTLLTLQIELEQIDAEHLAGLPDERIEHFNQVLREQLRNLQQQVAELARPVLLHLPARRPGPPQPDDLDRLVDAELQRARDIALTVQQDLQSLDDAKGRRAFFQSLDDPDDGGLDDDDVAMLQAMMAARPPSRRR